MSYPFQEGHLPPPPGVDAEVPQVRPESNFRGLSDVQKWKKEDWMEKGVLVLIIRTVALLFSFLTFILVVTIKGFTASTDLCYVFSIAIIVMVYTAVLIGIKGHELRTGEIVIPHDVTVWINFIGDQILTLLLLSSASSAASALRISKSLLGVYGGFQVAEQASGAVSMAFLGSFSLEAAALISGYCFALHLAKS